MNKIEKILIFMGVISLLAGIPSQPFIIIESTGNDNLFDNSELALSPSLNISDFVIFTGPAIVVNPKECSDPFRINIDDTNLNYSWSAWANETNWVTGSGTAEDPYIIENIFFDCQGDGGGIHVTHSKQYFIIRNCWVNNSGKRSYHAAVLTRWTENGIISENYFTYVKRGVWVEYFCNNIKISNNFMLSNHEYMGRGCDMDVLCENLWFTGNKVINFYDGLMLDYINTTIVRNNYFRDTLWDKEPGWEGVFEISPIHIRNVNYSKFTYNAFDGSYAYCTSFADITGSSEGNVITNNTQIINQTTSPQTAENHPKTQNANVSLVVLDNCNYNTIAHNVMYLPKSDSGTAITGYPFLSLILIFIVISLVALYRKQVKIQKKKIKKKL
ncbi:MAG: hypothetical protein ACFFB0_17550 [Promethearchaeota archaeon]